MTLSIRIKGLDASGVELLSPIRPEFDELARPLLGERIADIGLTLKPICNRRNARHRAAERSDEPRELIRKALRHARVAKGTAFF